MPVNEINNASSIDIAVSGMRAQSQRMKVIAGNIANANTSKTESGQPYRRQDVIMKTDGDFGGVTVEDIGLDESSPMKSILDPDDPNAGADGYVGISNVELPVEMMHMITASRAYQANVAMLKRYQQSVDVTLELLR